MAPLTLPSVNISPLRGGPTLKWGVLAPGGIARSWVGAVREFTDQAVVAVASRSLDRAQAFATEFGIDRAYGDYEHLVADAEVEAVYIAAPHTEHHRLALLAIAAGKHVLIEKPIAVSTAEAIEIRDAAHTAGVFAAEALWTRYLPQSSVIAQLLADGALGELRHASADFTVKPEFDPSSRMFDPALGGGALLDLGVYTAWFTHFVLGAPEAVVARGSLAQTGVDGQATLLLDYAGGAQSVITTGLFARGSHLASVLGTDARIDFTTPFMFPGSFTLVAGNDEVVFTDESPLQRGQGLAYQAVAVASFIADGHTESPLHSLDDSISVLGVLESARHQLGAK